MAELLSHPEIKTANDARCIDQRAWVRFATDLETCCHSTATERGDFWSARIIDLSAKGIGLELNRRFKPGTRLAVEVQHPESRQARMLVARVVHNQAVNDHNWIIGCEFETELTPEVLRDLL